MSTATRTRVVGGGVVLAIIAVVVVLALVVPALLRGGVVENPSDVDDISSAPSTTWSFDWVGDADDTFIEDTPEIAAVGENRALVWATFDSHAFDDSQGDTVGWYEGYDEQYFDGYAAGLQYAVAYTAWVDGTTFTAPLPRDQDYYPDGAYGDYVDWLGFDDGFWDARLDEAKGYSMKHQPETPDYAPTITLLDTASGEEIWTIDLAEAINGVDYSSTFYAFDIPGSSAVAVTTSTTAGAETTYAVAALSTEDGRVVSEESSPSPFGVAAFAGDLVVARSSDTKPTVSRYAVDQLGGTPKWSVPGPVSSSGASVHTLGTEFVQVIGDADGMVLSGSTGSAAGFGDDVDVSTSYDFAGGQLIRSTTTEDATSIDGWGSSGEGTWTKPVTADYTRVLDGMIFTAQSDGDYYSGLTAVNASTGAALWPRPWKGRFDAVYGVRNGVVLVMSSSTLTVLDAATGEKRFSQKLGQVGAVFEGDDSYYAATSDGLAAHSYAARGALWSYDLDTHQSVVAIGHTLGIVDSADGSLLGLAAK